MKIIHCLALLLMLISNFAEANDNPFQRAVIDMRASALNDDDNEEEDTENEDTVEGAKVSAPT